MTIACFSARIETKTDKSRHKLILEISFNYFPCILLFPLHLVSCRASNNWLYLLEGELLETRQVSRSDPNPSNNADSRTADENKHQTDVGIPVSVNSDKVNTSSNNKKHDYGELYGDSVPSTSKKRSYEELFGDISDILDTNVSGKIIH